MKRERILITGLLVTMAVQFGFSQSAPIVQPHVILPTPVHVHHDNHGHHHGEATPEHDHGSYGGTIQLWTVPARFALTGSSLQIVSLPAADSEIQARVSSDAAVCPLLYFSPRLEPPPGNSLSVLLI